MSPRPGAAIFDRAEPTARRRHSILAAVTTDLHIYNLDAVPPVHVVSNHVDIDKLTTANGGTFTSSSASRSSQSR